MQCESENLTHNEQAIAELLQNKHFSESVNGIVVRLQKTKNLPFRHAPAKQFLHLQLAYDADKQRLRV